MRPSLLPGLVDAVAHNRRHGRRDVALFEIGARFTKAEGERRAVAIVWTGPVLEHWSSPERDADFYDVKGAVSALAGALGVEAGFEQAAVPYLVPGQSAQIRAAGRPIGVIGRLSSAIVESRGAPRHDAVFAAELDLDRMLELASRADVRAQPLPRHPSVIRDLSIIVPDALPAEIIRVTIQRAAAEGAAPLAAVAFFDRYKGKGLADDAVSLSVRLTFQSPDRTLTDADVQQSFDRILSALVQEHGAKQR
jgi:phenylalanyl-tRNA synthetase beta chain